MGGQLATVRIEVDGRPATYGVAGDGPPVLFLHGWALGARAYERAVYRLTQRGCRVFAPALPGFAGTAALAGAEMSLAVYSDWVDHFMRAVGIDDAALVIGHSLGGGVAIKLAHAYPERVNYLVLLNSVGGVHNPPIWGWALRFGRELFPSRESIEILRAMRDDLVTNVVRNPHGLWRAGMMARTADLRTELCDLRERALPVLALTTTNDGVIPRDAFTALCNALGAEGHVVEGKHSWLLADPDSFDGVLANVIDVKVHEHHASAASRATLVGEALEATQIPTQRVLDLLRNAPPLWLMSATPAVLAGDIALCHPPLAAGEVRAIARRIAQSSAVRLTVAAPDRPGLLADTAAVLMRHGFAIRDASAATWPGEGLALHALTIDDAAYIPSSEWERLGDDLRATGTVGLGERITLPALGFASVTVDGREPERSLVRVIARDRMGLLAAICGWFADRDLSVESVHATTDGAQAHDVFVVAGPCDAGELADFLNRARARVLV